MPSPTAEVFPRPTVTQVVFAIQFPNLFFLESKIGDLQMRIMSRFPHSAELIHRNFVVMDVGLTPKAEEAPKPTNDMGRKIWRFQNGDGVEVNVQTSVLSITSTSHKSYASDPAGKNFREIIEFVTKSFLSVAPIPLITRIGLRYIDHCPFKEQDNAHISRLYNTSYPTSKFDYSDTKEMTFRTVVTKGDHLFIYGETLLPVEGNGARGPENRYLVMDFDAFRENIKAEEVLAVSDALHASIAEEFLRTVKEPVKKYMRGEELKDD